MQLTIIWLFALAVNLISYFGKHYFNITRIIEEYKFVGYISDIELLEMYNKVYLGLYNISYNIWFFSLSVLIIIPFFYIVVLITDKWNEK